MPVKQFEIWIVDLSPQIGTEPGKTRPVLVIQTDLLYRIPHPSTIVFLLTTNVKERSEILRVHIKEGTVNLQQSCDVMIDQVRAIDNVRLVKKIGMLPWLVELGRLEQLRKEIKLERFLLRIEIQ